MLEHIFRNMHDIRVFDVVYCDYCDGQYFNVDDIMDMLEYPSSLQLQIEDSIQHLIKQHILETGIEKCPSDSGCRTCLYTDKLHLPRIGNHKNHQSFKTQEIELEVYRIASNKFTGYLFKALFEQMQLTIEDINKE